MRCLNKGVLDIIEVTELHILFILLTLFFVYI